MNNQNLQVPKPDQLIGIQYLRAVAVILVVLDHTTGMAMLPKYFGIDLNIFDGWFLYGAVGVDLFFVISGFIILYVSTNPDLSPKIDIRSFFKHRFVRIVPFLWVCILGFALLKFFGRGDFPTLEYLRSVTLFPIGKVEPRPVWTLRHEFLFYSIFGLSVIYSKRKWVFLVLWILSPIVWFQFRPIFLPKSVSTDLADFLFSKHNLTFGIGLAIGLLFKKGFLKFAFQTSMGFFLCLVAAIPLLLVAQMTGMSNASSTFSQVLACGFLSAFIVMFGLFIKSKVALSKLDQIGLLIGDASYSIYLTHSGILSAMLGIWSKFHWNNPNFILISGCLLSLVGGIVIHLIVEKPLIKLIKNKMAARRTANTALA